MIRAGRLLVVAVVALTPALAVAASQTTITVSHLQDGFNTAAVADAHGLTLYMSGGDKNGRSNCYGSCTKHWKPLVASGKLVAGKGINGKLLGTTTRKDGTKQVTYNRHPLYRYSERGQKPGNYDGQGCGANGGTDNNPHHAHFYVLTPRGKINRGPIGICTGY